MLSIASIQSANKGQLRQFCRDNSVSYAGLDVPGMREALLKLVPSEGELTDALLTPPATQEADIAAAAVDAGVPHAPRVFRPEEAPIAPPAPEAPVAPRKTSKGVKVQKDRPMQNGVKMPSEGGACRAVWDYLQNEVDHGRSVSAKSVKEYAGTQGWNVNNASIEFYAWRKFHGITGRQK